jgi:hypothetical protein
MEKRMHFKVRIGKRINGDFEIGLKSGTVGTNMIFDGGNVGRR